LKAGGVVTGGTVLVEGGGVLSLLPQAASDAASVMTRHGITAILRSMGVVLFIKDD
jgi:hypothetical protein